jgi:hypothetical protein
MSTQLNEREEVMMVDHISWMMHPITKTLHYILKQHEDKLGEIIAAASMDPNLTDAHVRQLTVQLKTTKTIRKTIYDTPTFIARSR